jgi:hypothetical protein
MVKRWIQEALSKGRKGALSEQLGIPEEDDIPMSLLNAIIDAPIGTTIDNPTDEGHKTFKVTKLLKQRSVLAKNLKKIKR